jgi:hypothetical protein
VLELEGQCQCYIVPVRRWWWWWWWEEEEEDEDVSLEGDQKKIEVQGSSKIVSVAADLSAEDHLIQRTCPSFLAVRRAGPNATADRSPRPSRRKVQSPVDRRSAQKPIQTTGESLPEKNSTTTTTTASTSHGKRQPLLNSRPLLSCSAHHRKPSIAPLRAPLLDPCCSAALRCVALLGWFQHLVSPSCCISAARFLHRDQGSPRPPTSAPQGFARILRDDQDDHGFRSTVSACAWQRRPSQNSPSPSPSLITYWLTRSDFATRGLYTWGEIQTTSSSHLAAALTGHDLRDSVCEAARLLDESPWTKLDVLTAEKSVSLASAI